MIKKEFTKARIEKEFYGKKNSFEVGKVGVECLYGYTKKSYHDCGYQFETVKDAIEFIKNALNVTYVRVLIYEPIINNTRADKYIYSGSVKGV